MGPSLRDHSSFVRPSTRERPSTRDQGDTSLVIPSRTSSLHSRITQPIPSTLNIKPVQRTPKTLTHAYMVCGVGREPSQWVRAPQPPQGKIGHMKGAVGQFWLPEILGSSPRLEQDNDIARALHAAMRVGSNDSTLQLCLDTDKADRLASHMMSRFAPVEASHIACIIHSFCNKTLRILSTASPYEFGPVPMRNEQKRFAIFDDEQNQITSTMPTKLTGFHTA